jgi:hypothetical protein
MRTLAKAHPEALRRLALFAILGALGLLMIAAALAQEGPATMPPPGLAPVPPGCVRASDLRTDLPRYDGAIAARAVAAYNSLAGPQIQGAATIVVLRRPDDLAIAFVQGDFACARMHAAEPEATALWDLILNGKPGERS